MMRLIKAMWPCLKYRNVAKPQRTQKKKLGNGHHHLPSQPHPQSYFILLSVAQQSLFLPGEIRPHLLQGGPATLKSDLFLHPNCFLREILWWAHIESNAHLYQAEARGKHGYKESRTFAVLRAEGWADNPGGTCCSHSECPILSKASEWPSISGAATSSLAASLVNGQPVSAQEWILKVGPCSVLMLPDLYVFPLKSTKIEVSPMSICQRLRLLLKWLYYRGKPH